MGIQNAIILFHRPLRLTSSIVDVHFLHTYSLMMSESVYIFAHTKKNTMTEQEDYKTDLL